MDVVALNERLRDDFSALLKLLPPPFAVSAFSTVYSSVKPTTLPAADVAIDRYTHHCRLMLWRLNSYQYGSASAFLLDLEQAKRAAESSDLKRQVQRHIDRVIVSEGKKGGLEGVVKVANKAGATVFLGSHHGVPGLQEAVLTNYNVMNTKSNRTWLCNLSIRDQIVTIGTYSTQEEALMEYEAQRKTMASNIASFNKLSQLAAKMEKEQREENERVLKEAVAQCHPRLTTMKMAVVAAPAPLGSTRNTAPVVAKPLAFPVISSLAASPRLPEAGASPPRALRVLKRQKLESLSSFVPTKQKMEPPASSSLLIGNRSYLKLRRLIQTRMCKHLKGQDVCVLADPNIHDPSQWLASGRLEAGKVFSLGKKKQMTFADYVHDELGHAVSACAHMFLVQTKESIDDHLKVCDAFSDKERELGPSVNTKSSRRRR